MTFLHKETTWTIVTLNQVWEKSSYSDSTTLTWHLKAYSLEDTTFDPSWIDWSLYKFTVKGEVTIDDADKIRIDWTLYLVKDQKVYKWVWFNTTKILLATE